VAGLERGVRPIGDLVDVDDLVKVFNALNGLVRCGFVVRAVELACYCGVQGVVDQRGLARAGYAGDAGEQTDRKLHTHAAQVVAVGVDHANRLQLSLRGQVLGVALCPGQGRFAGRRFGFFLGRALRSCGQPGGALFGHGNLQGMRQVLAGQRIGWALTSSNVPCAITRPP
jgi:hypothetical protein